VRDADRQGLAVGFFDGVHLGHQAILRGASAVLTFRNHPLSVLAPERAPRLIMTPEERLSAIKACGVCEVTMLDFTRELAEMPPEGFLEAFLDKRQGGRVTRVRCGANWRFGKGGAGDAAFLRARGIETIVVPYAEYAGLGISSSRIRACLEAGKVEDANAMMGRRYGVRGARREGKGLGTELGYPTINLQLSTSDFRLVALPLGVYAVELAGQRGIANYGLAPTLGDRAWHEPVLEVHLLGPCPSVCGPRSSTTEVVEFVRFIRPERKFDSFEALKRQIAADCASVNHSPSGGTASS